LKATLLWFRIQIPLLIITVLFTDVKLNIKNKKREAI
jgi:hypothetical protein